MHLYGDILESYAARELPAQTLAGIDAHVSNCLFCAHALAEVSSVSARWERRGWLGRLVRVEEPVVAEAYAEQFSERAAA
jgi:hypothetical protein